MSKKEKHKHVPAARQIPEEPLLQSVINMLIGIGAVVVFALLIIWMIRMIG